MTAPANPITSVRVPEKYLTDKVDILQESPTGRLAVAVFKVNDQAITADPHDARAYAQRILRACEVAECPNCAAGLRRGDAGACLGHRGYLAEFFGS